MMPSVGLSMAWILLGDDMMVESTIVMKNRITVLSKGFFSQINFFVTRNSRVAKTIYFTGQKIFLSKRKKKKREEKYYDI